MKVSVRSAEEDRVVANRELRIGTAERSSEVRDRGFEISRLPGTMIIFPAPKNFALSEIDNSNGEGQSCKILRVYCGNMRTAVFIDLQITCEVFLDVPNC